VVVDEEGMYLELEPRTKGTDEFEEDVPVSDSEWESDYDDDDDYEEDEVDEMVKDKVPLSNPEIVYDKNHPPMTVGSIYENMSCFKLALATHAIRNEFEFNIEKSDPGRYRVYCSAKIDGCRWRILASTGADKTTVKVTLAILLFFVDLLIRDLYL